MGWGGGGLRFWTKKKSFGSVSPNDALCAAFSRTLGLARVGMEGALRAREPNKQSETLLTAPLQALAKHLDSAAPANLESKQGLECTQEGSKQEAQHKQGGSRGAARGSRQEGSHQEGSHQEPSATKGSRSAQATQGSARQVVMEAAASLSSEEEGSGCGTRRHGASGTPDRTSDASSDASYATPDERPSADKRPSAVSRRCSVSGPISLSRPSSVSSAERMSQPPRSGRCARSPPTSPPSEVSTPETLSPPGGAATSLAAAVAAATDADAAAAIAEEMRSDERMRMVQEQERRRMEERDAVGSAGLRADEFTRSGATHAHTHTHAP